MEEKRWRNVTWTPPTSRHCSDRLKKASGGSERRKKKLQQVSPSIYEFCVWFLSMASPATNFFCTNFYFSDLDVIRFQQKFTFFLVVCAIGQIPSVLINPVFRLGAVFFCLQFFTGRKGRVHKLMRLRRCEKKRISRVHFSPQLYTLLSSLLKSHFFFTVLFGPRNCHLTSIPPHWKPTWARNSCSSCANVHKMSSVGTKFTIFFAYFFLIIKKRKLFTKFFLVTLAIWTWAREESERERWWYEEGENVSERHTPHCTRCKCWIETGVWYQKSWVGAKLALDESRRKLFVLKVIFWWLTCGKLTVGGKSYRWKFRKLWKTLSNQEENRNMLS